MSLISSSPPGPADPVSKITFNARIPTPAQTFIGCAGDSMMRAARTKLHARKECRQMLTNTNGLCSVRHGIGESLETAESFRAQARARGVHDQLCGTRVLGPGHVIFQNANKNKQTHKTHAGRAYHEDTAPLRTRELLLKHYPRRDLGTERIVVLSFHATAGRKDSPFAAPSTWPW